MIYKKNWVLWLLFSLVISAYGRSNPKQQVCIIGGGMAGLVTVKQLSTDLKDDVDTIVFEKSSDIGGQWQYTDNALFDEHNLPVHSGIYKNLRTNGPKVLMSFPDYKEFHRENRSYVKHQTVLEYLTNFTEHFNLRQYIKFDTLVEKVTPLYDNKWLIKTRDLNNNKNGSYICHAVMLCNGHFTKPYSPNIPGIDTFPGRKLHSHAYRKPEEFSNQTVLILGASFSGIDIAIDMAKYVKTIYLSHRHPKIKSKLPKNIIQVAGVVAANGSDLILSDDSRVKADAFLFCTGYLYDYPFLDKTAGINITKGKYIHPLYKHLININYPTMFFVGLPHPGFPFMVPYVQAQYFISLFQGKAKLPSREVMLKESKLPPGTPAKKAHFMLAVKVMKYYNDVAKAARIDQLTKPLERAALIYIQDLKRNVLYFKDNDLIIRDNGRVDLIWPNNVVKYHYIYPYDFLITIIMAIPFFNL